jgi:hypothetical protein
VDVAIKPAAFPALTHTYKAASLAEPHGRLNLDVQCSFSDYPLLDPDPVRISLPLEFTPSFLHLAATVAAGAIVGWLFCTLASALTRFKSSKDFYEVVAKLIVSVLMGWILDIFSAITDSRLVLFGFDVAPTRLPSAFILGVISAVLGTWFLDQVVRYFDGLIRPPPKAPPPAPPASTDAPGTT